MTLSGTDVSRRKCSTRQVKYPGRLERSPDFKDDLQESSGSVLR